MKIAFITRSTLYSAPGGDTVQVEQTARHVRACGIYAEVKLAHEPINYDEYDLLHFFNLTRPADILHHIRKTKKPFVVSTIFVDYSEYDKFYRKGMAGIIFRYLSRDTIEWLKSNARFISGKDKLSGLSYFFSGQRKCITEILQKASFLLPNSEAEYEAISKSYHCTVKYKVVPNGVDDELFFQKDNIPKDPLMILCVARIEGIKNQINLIKALNGSCYKLFLIGKAAPNQPSYYKKCREIAGSNVFFIDHLPQQQLLQYYREAKVHILPSWFETTGLSSLEGAAMGCNIIITGKGFAKEYFGQEAVYCDPASPESIFAAVEKASRLAANNVLRNIIFSKYTWQHASLQTIKAYQEVMEK